ncbi:hypothetical protein B0H14DRAFT_3155975 [Mycena olivaceomarginata]|nr:hypothetical protein B0H14DRAFT_3155975 [Mycena olivaceomarginata]
MDTPPFPLEIFEVVTIAHPDTGPHLLRACHRAYLPMSHPPLDRALGRYTAIRFAENLTIAYPRVDAYVNKWRIGIQRGDSDDFWTAVHRTPHLAMGLACAVVKCSGIDAKSAGPSWVGERGLYIGFKLDG